jgi:hypothetical protein
MSGAARQMFRRAHAAPIPRPRRPRGHGARGPTSKFSRCLAPLPTYGVGSANFTNRSRSALLMTLTDDSAMASAAMMGDSSTPITG